MSTDLIRICHTAFTQHGSLFATLFIGGLAGGATHCAGMCGPFVLSQTVTSLDGVPLQEMLSLTRLRGAMLLPYHAGRLTTYALLGGAAALFSAQFRMLPWFGYFSAALLALAGLFFLVNAIPFLNLRKGDGFPLLIAGLFKISGSVAFFPLRTLFANPRGFRGYLLGLALGLLPCGLVYAALLAVAARGDPLTAILGMILFGIGTIPALVGVGVGGQIAFQRFRKVLRFAFPVLMLMNSVTLFVMAGDSLK